MKKSPLVLILSFGAFFFTIFILVTIGTLSNLRSPTSSSERKLFSKSTRLGVIEVTGVILDSKKTIEYLEKFEEDPTIKGIIVRLNSPGGAVAPSQEIYDAVKRTAMKKPVYSSMASVAASGAYYIASGTQKIFADAGTLTGSIGVIMQFIDMSKLYQWAKLNPYNIKTGKYKDIGAPDREMSVEEKQLLQSLIDNVLGQFRAAVSEGRKIPLEEVVKLSDGRIFSGEQAKDLKLVDELGGLHETAKIMMKEVKGEGKPILVYPNKHKHMFLEKFFEDDEDSEYGESAVSLAQWAKFLKLLKFPDQQRSHLAQFQGGPMFLMPLGIGF